MMRKLTPLSSIRRRERQGRRGQAERPNRRLGPDRAPMRHIGPGHEPMHAQAGSPRRQREPDEVQELEPLTEGQPARRMGPRARLGKHLLIQAEEGYRAGIIELRPGLFLVGEMASAAMELQTEFGAALLAPMMINAATKALLDPQGTQQMLQAVGQGASAGARFLMEPPRQPQAPPPRQAPYPPPTMAVQLALPTGGSPYAPPPVGHPPMALQLVAQPQPVAMGWYGPMAGWGPGVPATWATEADISSEFGCESCGGRCPHRCGRR